MWDLAVREEDYARADSLLRRKFTPDRLPLGHRALLAIVQRDSAALARTLQDEKTKTAGYPFASEWIALYLNDFPTAEAFAQAALASPRPNAMREAVHQHLARLALAQGRWSAARLEFARAERTIPSARRLHALSATWSFLAVPSSDLTILRAQMEAWDPGAEAPEPNPGLAAALRPHLRLYLLGLLSSRLGDDTRALDYANELQRTGAPNEARTLVRDLAQTVRAEVALRRGRLADALEMLESTWGEMPPELLADPFYSTEGSRYLRGELLYRLGRDEEALRWFSNAFQGSPNELVYLAPAHFRQAELYERLGDRKQAADHYGRFIRLWKSCDPEQRPSVEKAKARLEVLVGEPR
jgi:tetratricopeptide (TPR) repeat protein